MPYCHSFTIIFQFNEVFEVKEAHTLDKLVLDFDPKEKKELLSVDKTLVSKMKPHQVLNCIICISVDEVFVFL